MKSRRRSNTTTPPDPVFFVDRNLGAVYLPERLRAVGFRLAIHDDHFHKRQDVKDPEVIAACGENRWFMLTGDSDLPRCWRKEVDAAAIGVFCQTNNREGPQLWVPRIILLRAKILRLANKERLPFVAYITADAKPRLRLKSESD